MRIKKILILFLIVLGLLCSVSYASESENLIDNGGTSETVDLSAYARRYHNPLYSTDTADWYSFRTYDIMGEIEGTYCIPDSIYNNGNYVVYWYTDDTTSELRLDLFTNANNNKQIYLISSNFGVSHYFGFVNELNDYKIKNMTRYSYNFENNEWSVLTTIGDTWLGTGNCVALGSDYMLDFPMRLISTNCNLTLEDGQSYSTLWDIGYYQYPTYSINNNILRIDFNGFIEKEDVYLMGLSSSVSSDGGSTYYDSVSFYNEGNEAMESGQNYLEIPIEKIIPSGYAPNSYIKFDMYLYSEQSSDNVYPKLFTYRITSSTIFDITYDNGQYGLVYRSGDNGNIPTGEGGGEGGRRRRSQ